MRADVSLIPAYLSSLAVLLTEQFGRVTVYPPLLICYKRGKWSMVKIKPTKLLSATEWTNVDRFSKTGVTRLTLWQK